MEYDVFISYNSKDRTIAEAVCHYVEERRLRCFIAPRDVLESDWADNLGVAIKHSKAFIIIVSENSMASREVTKEITLATNVCDYIFPFRIDKTELNGRMNYHLAPFHWIDAMTPPLEQKLNELADRVAANLAGKVDSFSSDNLLGNKNAGMLRLADQSVAPRKEFLGRSADLEALDNLLQTDNAVFLTGMGGIGKSEIAKAYARDHRDRFTTTVFASFESDLLHLIASDTAIPVINLQQAAVSGGQGETTEAYFARKMNVLRAVVNQNTLLIIDNFDVESDPHLEEVLRLPCKQIWTTRTDFSSYGYATLSVGPLAETEDLLTLMATIDKPYKAPEDQEALRSIIHLLEKHTLAVSLTAAQMGAGWIKPKKMLEMLTTEGLNIKTRSVFGRSGSQGKSTAYGYIRALFDFSGLDEDACAILRFLACMPREGVEIDLFMECCGLDDFADISRLVEGNWVWMDAENGRIGLHMLIKELVWDLLTPTEENCDALLAGGMNWAKNAWNKPYDENKSHSSILFSLLEVFPKPTIRLLDTFEEMATFAWIMGRFDLSERCEKHLYALCAEHYGEVSLQAGNQALRVAAVYHNRGDYDMARPWYEKGLQVQEAINPNSIETYIARQKVARSNAQSGRYEEALEVFAANLTLIENLSEHFVGSEKEKGRMGIHLAGAKKYLAQIYTALGRYEEALPLAKEAHAFSQTDTVEPSLNTYSLTTLMNVYQGMGDYAKAVEYAKSALAETTRYHGEDRIDVFFLQEALGDLLVRQRQFGAAQEAYTAALVGRERLFPADVAALERLEEKIAAAEDEKQTDIPFLVVFT